MDSRSGSPATVVPAANQECESSGADPCARVDGQSYKALLIGIRGTATVSAEYPELRGSHKDVESLRKLLIECYHYRAADITTLIDDGIPGHVQPTRVNILKAIADLVKDAKPGDHFCFHYCGHSLQVPNRTHTEEDGLDECLIPSDGPDKYIIDNDLNAALVVPLPAGAQLVAVLDTCHSGSLLDLKHSRCNRVLDPWKKGSEEILRKAVQSNARLVSRAASILQGRKALPPSPTPSTRLLARPSEINMNLTCHPSPLRTASGVHDPEAGGSAAAASGSGPAPSPQRTFTYRARTVSFAKENDRSSLVGEDGGEALPGKFCCVLPEEDQCESPVAMFECTGFCRDRDKVAAADPDPSSNKVKADVISLASCDDSELTYEDADGKSMTSSLVEILRRDPNQSLKEVFVFISRAMHTKAVIRHEEAKKYKEYVANLEKRNAQDRRTMSLVIPESPPSTPSARATFPGPKMTFLAKRVDRLKKLKLKRLVFELIYKSAGTEYDMDDFQTPQLSSPRPLDMERRFWM